MNPAIRRHSNWLLAILLLICSLSILVPMYLTVVTALKTGSDSAISLWALPSVLHWSNFSQAVEITNFWHALVNSALITLTVVAFTVLTNSLVGYAIARNMHRRGFRIAFIYFLSAMFIPFPIIMLPLVKELSQVGLDNLGGLVLLYVVFNLPFDILLYTGYMQTIPMAIEEAAIIDGANAWQRFWRVVFPLLMPVNVTVAILTGLSTWNDFLLPLIVLSDQNQYTLPLVQYAFQSQFSTNYNLAFASYLMAMLPMVVIYFVAQRWIIGGVANGAIK